MSFINILKSRKFFKDFIDKIEVPMIYLSEDHIQEINLSAKKLLSFSPSDFKIDFKRFCEKHNSLLINLVNKDIKILEETYTTNDRSIIVLWKKVELCNISEHFNGLLIIGSDVSEERLVADHLRKTELFYNNILAKLPTYVYWKDKNCTYMGCNELLATALGLKSKEDIKGMTDFDFAWGVEGAAESFIEFDKKIMSTDQALTTEDIFKKADGDLVTVLTNKTPLKNEYGEVVGLLAISVDITEQKQTLESLKKAEGQLEGMTLVSSAMAHELRTPLSSICAGAAGLEKPLKIFIKTYDLAKENHLPIEKLSSKQIDHISIVLQNIKEEAKQAHLVINMLLKNLSFRHGKTNNDLKKISVLESLKLALDQYVFQSADQRNLINIKWDKDFEFYGDETLFTHVLLNFFKNSFYFIEKVNKGEIFIMVDQDNTYNYFYFKDTAKGISSDDLPHIFDQFFTKDTHQGTGIGLSFCKSVIESWGGELNCQSKLGDFIEFEIKFKK